MVNRVMCIVIFYNGSMPRARREVRVRRDHVQHQLKVNCLTSLQNYIRTLMTLLIWVTIEIALSVLFQVYLDRAKSLGFWFKYS